MLPGDPLIPILTAAEARGEEEHAFSSDGVQDRVVLESAGRALAQAVAENFGDGSIVGVLGRGNNGRDALVALRTLKAWGREVAAITVGAPGRVEDVLHGWEIPLSSSLEELATAGVCLDGLLGTGASGPPRAEMLPAIQALNASPAPVVAVDGPSGVDLSTGLFPSVAVEAQLTVTFGSLKRGLVLHPGRQLAGRILVAEIGLPPPSTAIAEAARGITEAWARSNLPHIAPDAYKTRVGIVTVAAGRTGMGGAPIMTAMGALRAGAGGVRILSTESNREAIHSAVPEAIFHDRGSNRALDALTGSAAVVIGPGIGTDEGSAELLSSILSSFAGPIVIDADALTIIAGSPGLFRQGSTGSWLLTPHPGELARLLDCDTAAVLADRFGAAKEASSRFRCTVLSKGAPSIVAAPGAPPLVALTGHSGVATGGMGDTLAGIAGAFMAAGADSRTGAALAIHFAGRAAELAGLGRGLLPRDVAGALPHVLTASNAPAWRPPFLLDLPRAE